MEVDLHTCILIVHSTRIDSLRLTYHTPHLLCTIWLHTCDYFASCVALNVFASVMQPELHPLLTSAALHGELVEVLGDATAERIQRRILQNFKDESFNNRAVPHILQVARWAREQAASARSPSAACILLDRRIVSGTLAVMRRLLCSGAPVRQVEEIVESTASLLPILL